MGRDVLPYTVEIGCRIALAIHAFPPLKYPYEDRLCLRQNPE
jgi:hypothetical protein